MACAQFCNDLITIDIVFTKWIFCWIFILNENVLVKCVFLWSGIELSQSQQALKPGISAADSSGIETWLCAGISHSNSHFFQHYNDMIDIPWALKHLKLKVILLFVQQTHPNNRKKTLRKHWIFALLVLCKESTNHWWFSFTKGKHFFCVFASSCLCLLMA